MISKNRFDNKLSEWAYESIGKNTVRLLFVKNGALNYVHLRKGLLTLLQKIFRNQQQDIFTNNNSFACTEKNESTQRYCTIV
jgi:hypothetical protein